MQIAKGAVGRPVTVLMMVAIVFLLGVISLTRLPIDLLPSIETPVIAVQTRYPDAGPFEVEAFVTRPIEEVLGTVNQVKSISSVSSRGVSSVIAQFDWGVDMDFAALDVREKVDRVRGFLPEEAETPFIVKYDPMDMPIMQIVLTGDASLYELRTIAEEQVKSRLERVSGVASVSVSGGLEREIQVEIHPGLLEAYGIPIDRVGQVLRAANLNLPAGVVEEADRTIILRTTGEFTQVSQIREVLVPSKNNNAVKLGAIAEVIDGFKTPTRYARLNEQLTVSLSIQKEAASNSVMVANLVREELERLNADLAPRARLVVADDVSVFVRQSIDNVRDNAIVGAILAMSILLLFLGDYRPTLIVGISIPIAILATFSLMFFSGISLNMISLGGLALGVGMLVDNAIVVIENISHHRGTKGPLEAAYEGAMEVGTAITASTLTSISVFIPVVFIAGVAAEIFRDMALTVTFSLIASLVISLSVVPMFASRILQDNRQIRALLFFSRSMERLQHFYERMIPRVLRYRYLTLGVTLALFLLSMAVTPYIGKEFMSTLDQGELRVDLSLPKGTPLAVTNEVVQQVERHLLTHEDILQVFATVGRGGAEAARIGVVLRPIKEREVSTALKAQEIREYLRFLPGVESRVSMVDTFGSFFGTPFQVELRGEDLEELRLWADLLVAELGTLPGLFDLTHSLEEGEPELKVQVDREKAAFYGVSVGQVASVLRTSVSGMTVTRFKTAGKEIDVTLRIAAAYRESVEDIERIPISTARGVIPLREIATLTPDRSPISINRDDRSRMVAVTGNISGRDLGTVMEEASSFVESLSVPPRIQVSFGGQNQMMQEAFSELLLALILGVVLVYMILASQFESLLQPFIIMITLPLAGIGVVWGLFVADVTLSVISFVGIIMLAGIVVNNGIVLIDYINALRAQGKSLPDAVVEAGSRRLRPILMTSLTTILGMVPLSLGLGDGRELQQPIAVVVIGGLLTSTILTLLVIPAFYVLLEDLRNWSKTIGFSLLRRMGQKQEG